MRRLTDENFAIENGKALCKPCWISSLSRECCLCQRAVLIQNLVQFAGCWHEKCFRCQQCHVRLEWRTPVVCGKVLYCQRCISGLKTQCAVCGAAISGEIQTFEGRVFHLECFTCSVCNKPIVDDKFQFDGKLTCAECLRIG
jgi:hypothetical protein